eukprot:1159358-Pelagomonas_calceolata.AAC.10
MHLLHWVYPAVALGGGGGGCKWLHRHTKESTYSRISHEHSFQKLFKQKQEKRRGGMVPCVQFQHTSIDTHEPSWSVVQACRRINHSTYSMARTLVKPALFCKSYAWRHARWTHMTVGKNGRETTAARLHACLFLRPCRGDQARPLGGAGWWLRTQSAACRGKSPAYDDE